MDKREEGLTEEVSLDERETEDEADEFEDDEEIEEREDDLDDPDETAAEETEEIREDAAKIAEGTKVVDLDARALQAQFTLVDYKGQKIIGQREGLLLFNGGTVCDEGYFNQNSADAICRTMGYASASSHRKAGLYYRKLQRKKRVKLSDVVCSTNNWDSCRAKHNKCKHSKDIFLTCIGTGFKLISRTGGSVSAGEEGLLTYQHGTVCGNFFRNFSAHAICKVMGYAGAVIYRTPGVKYGEEQTHRIINMSDVICNADKWHYCKARTHNHYNCNHSKDVFLTCKSGSKKVRMG